jgi:hypothetical protein
VLVLEFLSILHLLLLPPNSLVSTHRSLEVTEQNDDRIFSSLISDFDQTMDNIYDHDKKLPRNNMRL